MRAFSYVRSLDKDGSHASRSAVSKNPVLHADFMALCCIEPELLPIQVFTLWE